MSETTDTPSPATANAFDQDKWLGETAVDLSTWDRAVRMWSAYSLRAGGKTFDGKPLPTWDELGHERQACWVAAALA